LASFWRFSITASSPSFGFTDYYTILSPHAPRSTLHAPRAVVRQDQRGQVVRRLSPAGYCLPPTAELPKTERDPISTSDPSIFSMSPNQAIPTEKSMDSSPLAAAHPLRVLSWPRRSTPVSSGVPAGWLPAAMPVLSSLWQAQYLCFPRSHRLLPALRLH